MRIFLVVFLMATTLAGCNDEANNKRTQRNSDDAAERVYDQLGDSAYKRIKKDDN